MAKKDYYAILNIDPKANLKSIKSAYRQMALKYHPDHNPGDANSLKQFNLVREAYEFLTNPDLKKNYDANYQPQKTQQAKRETSSSSNKQNSKNLRYNLYITLEDVLNGCERTIRYLRRNKSEKETVQLKVKVPKGAFQHQRLKLSQFGDSNGESYGDLFVIIHLQNHPLFIKKDLNLRINVPITYIDIALGNSIAVPTLSGVKKVKLKACEFENTNVTLTRQGLPEHKSQTRGDLIVHFFIEHPKRLNSTEKNALQKSLKTWPRGELMQQYDNYLNQIKSE